MKAETGQVYEYTMYVHEHACTMNMLAKTRKIKDIDLYYRFNHIFNFRFCFR